jgi:hypothetical protein
MPKAKNTNMFVVPQNKNTRTRLLIIQKKNDANHIRQKFMRYHIKYYVRSEQVSFSNCYNGIIPIINIIVIQL